MKTDDELIAEINQMSRLEMARVWRFAESGDLRLSGRPGEVFVERFWNTLGGFTPEISKQIGWRK